MIDNSLIARLERLKKEVRATALIDEAIASLKALYDHAKFIQSAANTAMIADPAKTIGENEREQTSVYSSTFL